MTTSASDTVADSKALRRVLLVEDDAILAMTLEDALRAAGASEVIICATMLKAVRELEHGPRPDAMILDVHLADRDDGWALAELVDILGPKPPRIVFSTGTPQDVPESARGLGPVFEKPYDPADLVQFLQGEKRPGLLSRLRFVRPWSGASDPGEFPG